VLETIIDLAVQADIYTRISSIPTVSQDNQSSARRVILYLALFAFAQSVPLLTSLVFSHFLQRFPVTIGNRGRVAAEHSTVPIPNVGPIHAPP
jgi:hypothetical protein